MSESFREFVVQRSPALSRTAYLLTGDHQLAEDLLQSALARSYRHWRRIREGDPEAYVRRVMYHQQVSWWRRRRVAERLDATPNPTRCGARKPGPGDQHQGVTWRRLNRIQEPSSTVAYGSHTYMPSSRLRTMSWHEVISASALIFGAAERASMSGAAGPSVLV